MPIRVKLDRPMKLGDCATWDGGKTTWGGRVEAMGTVPVCVCTQESWGEGTGFWREKRDLTISIRVYNPDLPKDKTILGRIPILKTLHVSHGSKQTKPGYDHTSQNNHKRSELKGRDGCHLPVSCRGLTTSYLHPWRLDTLLSDSRHAYLSQARFLGSVLDLDWCQETIRDTIAQTRFESVSKHSNNSLLARGYTLRSDEDSMKLNELMELYTNLQNNVLDLEKIKTTQRNKIDILKRRVKKLEKRNRSRTHKLKRLYKVGLSARVESSRDEESLGKDASKQGKGIDAIDADEDITLVNNDDKEMFYVGNLGGEEVFVAGQNDNVVEEVVNAAQVSTVAITVTITTEEITLAQVLEALKTLKPKVKGIVFQNPASKDKEVHMTVRDYDDTLVCCIENAIKDCIMDFGASFHATYYKEELESWTLKDVRYILGLKRRLIFVGQLDEEGYHVGFGDQQWKVTKGKTLLCGTRGGHMSEKVKILAAKGRIPDLHKAIVGFCEPCVLGKQKKADLATMLPLSMTTARRYGFIFLKKIEVFNTFNKWKADMENEDIVAESSFSIVLRMGLG
nr:hypothetical protein [Tanacetum cinerariifolium]